MAFRMDWVTRKRINRNIDPGNLNIRVEKHELGEGRQMRRHRKGSVQQEETVQCAESC